MMDTVKRIALATLITGLVWSYADQVSETTERLRVTVQIPKDDDWYVSPRSLSGRIVLSGTRRSIQALREKAPAGELRIEQKADELGLAPGSGSVDLARLVGAAPLLRDLGLRVVEAEPAILRIEVDKFESHEVRVVRTETSGALTAVFDPPQVMARVPSLVWDANRDAVYAELSLDGLSATAGTNEPPPQEVLLTVPTSLQSYPITFEPNVVTVQVQANQMTVKGEFPGVPIRYEKNHILEQDWTVQLVGDEDFAAGLFPVTLEGPAEIIQQLQRADVWLGLDVRSEDASTGGADAEPVERALELRLSNRAWLASVRFATEAPKVKFRLRRFVLAQESPE